MNIQDLAKKPFDELTDEEMELLAQYEKRAYQREYMRKWRAKNPEQDALNRKRSRARQAQKRLQEGRA